MNAAFYILMICLSTVAAPQAEVHKGPTTTPLNPIDRDKGLHDRALGMVQAERARAKQPLCPKAMTTLDVNKCYSAEVAKTDANYTKLVRTLGILLRSGEETGNAAPARIPFDDAEDTWHRYRESACHAAGAQYEGGTIRPSIEMGCILTLTRHHMDELWELYSDLGTL
jgi:uncharacterized protein YecT (DUF1311 family)